MRHRYDSDLERKVWIEFVKSGIETGSCPEAVPGRPDFVIRGQRIAVFVHGCYWHRHWNCPLLKQGQSPVTPRGRAFTRNVLRDGQVREHLRKAGWSVAILWECSIKNDATKVVNEFNEFIMKNQSHQSPPSSWLYVA